MSYVRIDITLLVKSVEKFTMTITILETIYANDVGKIWMKRTMTATMETYQLNQYQ